MKTVFSKLNHRSLQPPVYISREQFRDAYYIPSDANIVIVDFKEEDDEHREAVTEDK